MMKKSMNYWRTVVGCLPFLMLASCTDDNPLVQEPAVGDKTHVLFAVDDFETVGSSRTVTYLDDATGKYKVKWASGDVVGIFPYEGYQQPFVIPTEQIDQNFATFDGGYWALKKGLTYNAYYPFSEENFFSTQEGEALNIPVSYEGQTQEGSAYSVGAYDYTYSEWQTAPETGGVTFNFHHIGSLVLVHLVYPATAEFQSLALCTGVEELIPLTGTYDLTFNKDKTPEGETYVKIPFVCDEDSKAAALNLALTDCSGTEGESNTFYLMMPPVDLSAATTMSFRLTDSNGKAYDMKVTPTKFESGKKYEFSIDARPIIDLSQYTDGATIDITESSRIIGDGNDEYNLTLNVAADATVIFEVGTSGVKLNGQVTVADGKTLTLRVEGDAEHTVNGGISLGNGSNVIIEGDLTQANNKLTVTATGSNAGIGANNGVTAGDITIRNARVDATGSGSADSPKVAGAGIGTAKASMGNILIVNSIVTAAGGYYSEYEAHGAAIGMGSDGVSMGNISLIDSEITASHSGEGHASIIGAGPDFAEGDRDGSDIGTMGDIIITNTDLHLSMAESTTDDYAAMIGTADFSGGLSYSVNMGKIIFTDITQAELDEMIATWYIPSDFDEYGGYVLGLGYWSHVYKYNEYEAHCVGTFGGVWVSDGNGDSVKIGDVDGYINPE